MKFEKELTQILWKVFRNYWNIKMFTKITEI